MKFRKLIFMTLSGAFLAGAASASFAQYEAAKSISHRPNKAHIQEHEHARPAAKHTQSQGAVFISDSDYPVDFNQAATQGSSGKTRAQVIAELNEARAKGQLDFNDSSFPPN